MKKIVNHFKSFYLKYISAFIFVILCIVIYCSLRNNFKDLINYVNSLEIAGISLILISGLSFVTKEGAFNIFTYVFAPKYPNGTKMTLAEYNEHLEEKRKGHKLDFLPYLFSGLFFTILGVILKFLP